MRSLLQKLGLISKATDPLPLFTRDLGLEVVKGGNPSHQHQFAMVSWDDERFGSNFVDPDPDPGGRIAFPMATYKELLRCSCGAEAIKSVRALI